MSLSVSPQLTTEHPLVLSLIQSVASLPRESSRTGWEQLQLNESLQNLSLAQAHELICQFFIERRQCSSESVLQEFKYLFIEPTGADNLTHYQALECIVSSGSEETFINTLKRTIYILVNNWNTTRQQTYVHRLVQLLSTFPDTQTIQTIPLKQLALWRRNFINSQDYQELQLFASRLENRHQQHWSDRYSSYLLVSQSVDVRKSLEQQEAARIYSKQLKEQFKLKLAMYTARCSSSACQPSSLPNPTILGDEVLRLIQEILRKRGHFSYVSLARIFLDQTRQIRYKDFKQNLLNYLFFSLDDQDLAETLNSLLSSQLNSLYKTYDNQPRTNSLLLRTCNWLVEYFTTMDRQNPSLPFVLLITQDKALSLAILLLKIVLICPQAKTHLECCLSQLIQYYKGKSKSECQWLIEFLEIIQIALTVYADDVHYNLVSMSGYEQSIDANDEGTFYRIFSQKKPEPGMYQQAA